MNNIKPKMAVSNINDFFIFIAIGVIQVAILFLLPSYGIYLLTKSAIAAFAVGIVLYSVFMSFCALSITLSENGIKLNRKFGSPKNISWSNVQGYKEVSPKEVIIFGWLWPIFPPRESTPCMSCYGHFRISYDGGYFYYPPNDKENFIQLMIEYGAKEL
ncbi:hypothetical protein NBRC116583_39230 [Arenicella sp. 4NH20-0111]|uniref:hypothetical protein n=1 Tax=Arenicella sp. 4NH20-0111 TaxID=3127648 RepID=UPI003108FF4C